jgi:cholestenol delta-isomerase
MSAIMDHLASNATKMAHVVGDNPYYPVGSYIANYAANEWSVPALLTVFFGACFLLFTTTYVVAKSTQPHMTGLDLITTMWFVLSGAIHLCFEGYYAVNFATLGSKQTILGQLWKEYAFSDSRYLTNDAFVLCMESVTAFFWGPGCLIVAAMIILKHPMRFPLQLIVSLGQFYGDILYYSTCMFDHYMLGKTYSRPEAFYFWFYFFFMNFIWIVIPGCESERAPQGMITRMLMKPQC